MSAEKNIEKSREQLTKIGETVNEALLEKVVKGLGIANRSVDASLVSGTDPEEVARLKANYVQKKLGIEDEASADAAIEEVIGKMSEFRQKQRGAVYYLLCEKFGKQSVYKL